MPDAPAVLARTKDVDAGALDQAAADANALRSAARELEGVANEVRHAGLDIGIEGRSADAAWPQFDGLRRRIVTTADDLVAVATAALAARGALAAAQAAYDQLPPGDIPPWQKAALIGGGAVLGPAGPIAGAVLAERLGDEQAERRRAEAEAALQRLTSAMETQSGRLPSTDEMPIGGEPPVAPGPGGPTAPPPGGTSSPYLPVGGGGGSTPSAAGGGSTSTVSGFDAVRGTGSTPVPTGWTTAGAEPSGWPDRGGWSPTGASQDAVTVDGAGGPGRPGWSPGSADGAVNGTTGTGGGSGAAPGWAGAGAGGHGTAGGAGGIGGGLAGGLAVGGAALGSAGLRGAGRQGTAVSTGALLPGPGAHQAGRSSGLAAAGNQPGTGAMLGGGRTPLGGSPVASGPGLVHQAQGTGAAAGGRTSAASALRGSALTPGAGVVPSDAARGTSSAGGGPAMVPSGTSAQRADGPRRRRPTDGLLLPDVELEERSDVPSRSQGRRAGRRGTGLAATVAHEVPEDDGW